MSPTRQAVDRPSEQPVFDLDADGFAVYPGVLPAAGIDALRAAVSDVLVQPPAEDPWLRRLDVESPFNFNYLQRVHLWRRAPAFLPIYRSLGLGEILASNRRPGPYRIFFDAFLAKLAYGEISRWHVDGWPWPFDPTDAVTIWIALDDVTSANGCLAYLPGSHHVLRDTSAAAFPPGIGGLQELVPALKTLPVATCPLPSRSVVVHDAHVAHAVLPNLTSVDRWVVTLNLVPSGAIYTGPASDLLPPRAASLIPGVSRFDEDQAWPLL